MSIDWGSVPDSGVAVTAVFGVGAGLVQLSSIRRANHQAIQFERARLLLEFDRDFESDPMRRARQRTLVVTNRIETEVAALDPPIAADRQRQEIAQRFSDYASAVWRRSRTFDGDPDAARDSASDEYMVLMRLPNWCETLGHQCRRDLLPLDDVLNLYDALIISVVGNLALHIQLRAEEGAHRNPRYLENALWLYERAKAYKLRSERRLDQPVSKSRLRWGD